MAASTKFVFPPTDGSVPPSSISDFHLEHNPSHVFAILYDINNSSQTNVTHEQLACAVHRAAHILNPNGAIPQGTNIGLLLSTHAIQYAPFPISPRTHVSGIAHLLKSTQTALVVAGGSQAVDDIIPQLSNSLAEVDSPVQFIDLPSLDQVLPDLGKAKREPAHKPFPPLKAISGDTIISILHSTGSTGMPKPINIHLEGLFKNSITQPIGRTYAQEGARSGTMALPTFHGTVTQIFAGGPLAEATGNKLAEQGVRFRSCYGTTELGGITEVDEVGEVGEASDRNYVRFSPRVDVRFIPQNNGDNLFELAFVVSDNHKPFVINFEIDGRPAYRTKDLVVRHPYRPDLWKLVGRLDDQIILLNGEKANPGPMGKCPIVLSAIMFGRERSQTGVLIELEESVSSMYATQEGRLKAIDEVWPFIERANQTSATHSRLERRTIILVDPTHPLPRTVKEGVSRPGALKLYASVIEEMYLGLEKNFGAADGIKPPRSWIVPKILNLTATMLLRLLKDTLNASPDFHIRSAATKVNQQTIFGNPTITQLVQVLVQLSTCNNTTVIDPVAEALRNIHTMIEKYKIDWPAQEARDIQPVKKERVVVTGTTGGLGSHLLAQLLENEKVEKVWAMNRKSSKNNRDRELSSFEDKLLDDPKLALPNEIYDEIRREATIIIHNAWQVNFNLGLQSFEPSICGARNLLDLAFQSTAPTGLPRFIFTSSVSVAGFAVPGRWLSEISVTPEMASTSIGYGQSKLVAEKLLESARDSGLESCSIRLGQLVGDVKSGAWSTTDWVPSLIASSVSIGSLPRAVGEQSPTSSDAHLTPRPVPWVDLMNALSASLVPLVNSQLPIVGFEEWNKRVAEAAESFKGSESDRYKRFPSTKIQSTIDGMVLADKELQSHDGVEHVESCGTVRLNTKVAEEFSRVLETTPQLGDEHVQKWISYWELKGYLFSNFVVRYQYNNDQWSPVSHFLPMIYSSSPATVGLSQCMLGSDDMKYSRLQGVY
ncbi:Male sterility protein [Rhizoctonia solani]|uniref:Male sterility protein n=1 Tax=Rhizoctonia solani TaxID=456999 RepID=A0A8H7LYW2_9AGAM|nr:Male sterility protein [Rhizoctonia solani]